MTKLKLTRPLAILDLETTGINVASDKIVQIAIIKVFPSGKEEQFDKLINPGIPIPVHSSEIHGIYDKDVKDKPTFKEEANTIDAFLKNCDLAGYNSNKFDIPILVEEFLRVDIDFDVRDRKTIDVQNLFHLMEKRTLKAAYKFYTGEVLQNAHNAISDTQATYKVLLKQIERYEDKKYHSEEEAEITPIKNDINVLHQLSTTMKMVDFLGRIVYDENNVEIFNFGKYKGKAVREVLQADTSYYNWMMKGDFPLYTKKVLTEIKDKMKLEQLILSFKK